MAARPASAPDPVTGSFIHLSIKQPLGASWPPGLELDARDLKVS